MKIAINQQPYAGPWGGGNRFIAAITEALRARGHDVIHRLERGTDIILMVETRLRSPNVTFDAGSILRHLAFVDKNAVVVHRINECDERKGEKFITHRLLRANYAADLTVFVGSWLMELPAWKNKDRDLCGVILNGTDTSVFHPRGHMPWDGREKIRIVTHHWSPHPFKGLDVYKAFDDRLDDPAFAARVEMTYIGNLQPGFSFRNVRHVAALNGEALADELRHHHVYLTASINEPGGNHQNEGAACGLPLLYRNSGCMPEYCEGFGVMFNGPDDVFQALETLRQNYAALSAQMGDYPHTAPRMAADWAAFFEDSLKRRDALATARNVWRDPALFLRNQIPL